MMRSVEEIETQYAELIRLADEPNIGTGRLGYLVGAAYTLKWVLQQEDGGEFKERLDALIERGHTATGVPQ